MTMWHWITFSSLPVPMFMQSLKNTFVTMPVHILIQKHTHV